MKSFGVRLGAGAVTILFGAYAAALAQKDRQDESDSWTAENPSIAQPATPIADIGQDSWLKEPETALARTGAGPVQQASSTLTQDANGAIQLVQHAEPVDAGPVDQLDTAEMSALGGTSPAALQVTDEIPSQDASPDSGPSSDWLMPQPAAADSGDGEFADSEEVTTSGPGMTMVFPDPQPDQAEPFADAPSAEGGIEGGSEPMSMAGSPGLTFHAAESIQFDESELSATISDVTDEVEAVVEGSELADAAAAGAAIIGAGAAAAASLSDDAMPANLLRGTPEGINALRNDASPSQGAVSDPASMVASTAEAAQAEPLQTEPSDSIFAPSTTTQADPGAAVISGGGQLAQDSIGMPPSGAALGPTTGIQAVPTAGLGAPQVGGMGPTATTMPRTNAVGADPQSINGYPQPGMGLAAERTASLSREAGGAAFDGYAPQAMAAPTAASEIDPAATLDSPGERRLEGAQTPSIVIQKRAPAEVKVGKPASFVVHVQNVGAVEALNVEVHDRVPAGMKLIDASPSPVQQGDLLLWQIGSMPAGDERTITMQLVPEQEGELGSVARVSFEAAASVRTISTRPELKIVQRVPEQGVLIGQQLEIELEVSNPGSGAATGVVLQEDVPEGLEHPKGRQLDNAIGTLAPGEVRRQVLRLRAVSPGVIQNTIRLVGDDGLSAEHTVSVQVVAPKLQVELQGPSKRFLERQATYQLNVANSGTADATNVEISVQLDRGFTFVSTDYEGQYDPSRHAVFWSLAQLPAGASGSVPLTLLPVQAGEQAIKIDARADLGVTASSERTMSVEGFAELSFAISNAGGPIEVGAETNYEIRVTNSGSKPDSNVRVQVQLPQGLELVSSEGEAGTDGRGLVAFQPRTQLAPGEEIKYGLRVRGVSPGTHIVRAIVVSDQSTVPVTKEDSTRVYADQ